MYLKFIWLVLVVVMYCWLGLIILLLKLIDFRMTGKCSLFSCWRCCILMFVIFFVVVKSSLLFGKFVDVGLVFLFVWLVVMLLFLLKCLNLSCVFMLLVIVNIWL